MGLFRSMPREAEAASESERSSSEDERARGGWRAFDRRGHGGRSRAKPTKSKPKPSGQDKDNKHGRSRDNLPTSYASTAAVTVYASCRLRRVWFSAEGDRSLDVVGVREEWALYAE
jgi:hypothetical protein